VHRGADVDGVGRIDRAVAFLDVLDLALLVDDKRGAVGKLKLVVQDAVFLRHLPRHVAQQRKFHSDFFGERLVGGRSVNADAKDFCIFQIDLARIDTRLVSLQLFRSAARKGQNVERQDDVFLAAVVAQLHRRVLIAAQREIGRHVSDFQRRVRNRGLRRRRLLRPSRGQSEYPGQEHSQHDR